MNILKKLFPYRFKRKIKEGLGVPSLHWSLRNLKKNKFYPSFILDIGAYEGNWTKDVLEVYPAAKILMVEAQKNKEGALQRVKQTHQGIDYAISLLSSADGSIKLFRENETASQVLEIQETDHTHYTLKSQTLDSLLMEKYLPYPDLLKLDVQGHEMEVLKGAIKSLAHAEVCLLEVSLLNLGDNSPLVAEMIAFMDEKQFQVYDISQFMRRPFDQTLYQLDMFFVKKDSALIASKRWA